MGSICTPVDQGYSTRTLTQTPTPIIITTTTDRHHLPILIAAEDSIRTQEAEASTRAADKALMEADRVSMLIREEARDSMRAEVKGSTREATRDSGKGLMDVRVCVFRMMVMQMIYIDMYKNRS